MGEFALDDGGQWGPGFEIWPSLSEMNLKSPLQTCMVSNFQSKAVQRWWLMRLLIDSGKPKISEAGQGLAVSCQIVL